MRIERFHRNLTLPETLLFYTSTIFAWELVFHIIYNDIENIGFLSWAGAAVSIYLFAKYLLRPDFFGRYIKYADVSEIFFVSVATVMLGVGSWSLLVYLDASLNGQVAMDRWGLISVQDFEKLRWSKPWLIGQVIVSVLLVPIIEEIVFRGLILRRLLERYTPLSSIVISAGIFAIFHYNKSFIGVFLHGIVFGVLAIRMSSIYVPIVVHCAYNLIAVILRVFFGFSLIGDRKLLNNLDYWYLELLCGLVGLIALAVYFSHVLKSVPVLSRYYFGRREGKITKP